MKNIKYKLKRILEKTVYKMGQQVYGSGAKRYFEVRENYEEKLPESSAILTFNHTFGLDGIFTCVSFPRQIHQMIQFEGVYNRNPYRTLGLWSFGFIPVSVGVEDENKVIIKNSIDEKMNLRAIKRAKDYLTNYDDFVGIFVDGPAFRLIDHDGKIQEKKDRKLNGSAAALAIMADRPIIPVGMWMPEDIAERLWEFGFNQRKQNAAYLEERRKKLASIGQKTLIPYEINVGKPIYPRQVEGTNQEKRKKLNEIVKNEIVRLSQRKSEL